MSRSTRFSALLVLMSVVFASHSAFAGGLVISQVYGGGNSGTSYTNDFIELLNNSGAAIDLSTYSVQHSGATSAAWTRINLTGTLPDKTYYLIQLASGDGGSALPTPDLTNGLNIDAAIGKVALCNDQVTLSGNNPSSAAIIDKVGYGPLNATNAFYETAAAPGGSPTTAVLRKNLGQQDTNDNSADFVAGTPTPRNTGSAPVPIELTEFTIE